MTAKDHAPESGKHTNRQAGTIPEPLKCPRCHCPLGGDAGVPTGSRCCPAVPAVRPGYMRRGDAAKHCGVSIRTLADWQAARIVPYIRISHRVVLFKISELEKALDRFTIKAIGDSRP